VLADLVVVPDFQVAALAGEAFIEGIGAEDGARRNFVALPQRGPALDIYIRFEQAVRADRYIAFDHAELADTGAGPDHGIGVNARGRSDRRGGINGHEPK
jgi:hypothetical protein